MLHCKMAKAFKPKKWVKFKHRPPGKNKHKAGKFV